MSLIERLRDLWPHDDSPGYTDHPENDIRAHRANAKWMTRLAFVGLAFFAVYGAHVESMMLMGAGLIAFGLMEYGAMNMRIQALEWEAQLMKEDD